MENSGRILWNNVVVGTVTNIKMDMWYLESNWHPVISEISSTFVNIASKLLNKEVIQNPSKGIIAQLNYDDADCNSHYVLILSLEDSILFMRMANYKLVAYVEKKLLEPWQDIETPHFHENNLKRKISFFHYLNWKGIRAIAQFTELNKVIFEVLNGKFKYVVVQFDRKDNNSTIWPNTTFYKDWDDLFENRLIADHEAYMAKPILIEK